MWIGEKSLLLDAGRLRGLLLDVDRREITAAGRGDIARHPCVLLDTGRRETAAAGRGTARNDCCWMPNMDKSLLLDEGRRETNTASGRLTARNHYCCGVGRTVARNHS